MNEEYIDNVKELIEEKDADKVKELLIDLHPADIAELCNELNPEEARFVYRLLDNETAADVLVEMDEDVRKEFLDILPSETAYTSYPFSLARYITVNEVSRPPLNATTTFFFSSISFVF